MSEHVIERTNAGFGVMVSGQRKKATVMTDGPIYRSDDDIAEALAIQHGNSIRDRIDPAVQERINQMFVMQDGINEMFAQQERINAMFEIGRD